jgi:hypothetical protein
MQVKSKSRVADHGEVFTSEREVNAMLDLVKQETLRIDSRFLEPACGTGNFLAEILRRKLAVVQKQYKRNQLDFEKNTVIAISSIYGIDILEDNVKECQVRLFNIFDDVYTSLYKKKAKVTMRETIKYILDKNIIHGDALSLKTNNGKPITFAEWSMVSGSMIKRRDYHFESLSKSETKETGLFAQPEEELSSDLGEDAFIPKPDRTYPSTHFLRIADVG